MRITDITEVDGKFKHTCSCGYSKTLPVKAYVQCPACRGKAKKEQPVPTPPPLGDKIEEFLKSYSITPEWWSGFKEKFGLPPGCGCAKRREWVNKTAEAHPAIANFGAKLVDALKKG